MANPLATLALAFSHLDRGDLSTRLYVKSNFGVHFMLAQYPEALTVVTKDSPRAWGNTLSQCCGEVTQETVPRQEYSCVKCFGDVPAYCTLADLRKQNTLAPLLPLTSAHLDPMAGIIALDVLHDVIRGLANRPVFYWVSLQDTVGLEAAQQCLAKEVVGSGY